MNKLIMVAAGALAIAWPAWAQSTMSPEQKEAVDEYVLCTVRDANVLARSSNYPAETIAAKIKALCDQERRALVAVLDLQDRHDFESRAAEMLLQTATDALEDAKPVPQPEPPK